MRVQFVLNPFDGSETFGAATSASQSTDLANQSSDEWLSQRSGQYRKCTTVTRVLHEGTELPKDKPIQWFVDYLIAGEASRQTAATPVIRSRKPLTGWDPPAATLTLHIECSRDGRKPSHPFHLAMVDLWYCPSPDVIGICVRSQRSRRAPLGSSRCHVRSVRF